MHIGRGLYYNSYKSPRVLLWSIGVIILVLMMAIGFLGYVIPFGQMSLWGATVITNLLSAIPVFGQDIVELIYKIENLTLITKDFFFFNNLSEPSLYIFSNMGIITTNGQTIENTFLPTIGTVSPHAWKKKIRKDKKEYLSIPSQFIAFFVGLIDGDGYIQVTKTTKGFITIKLTLTLSLDDLSTLEYIHSVWGLGLITISKDRLNPICTYRINRTDLQEVIFPLLHYHKIFFLINSRRKQYNKALYILKNDVKLYDEKFLNNIPNEFNLPDSSYEYLNLNFYKNWLIGFTNSEGSFLIKKNNDGCFQLKQRIDTLLFESFNLLFKSNRKIDIELDKYAQFSVSSKKDIQEVINYFSFSGLHPLVGKKNIQYFKWLNDLQNSKRYKDLNYPL